MIPGSASGGGIRLAVQQSLARTTPQTSFGSVLKEGLTPTAPRVQPPVPGGTAPLRATLEGLVAAMWDIEAYARRHSPGLMSELARMRFELQVIAARCQQPGPPVGPPVYGDNIGSPGHPMA
jgi:hypothetical protein